MAHLGDYEIDRTSWSAPSGDPPRRVRLRWVAAAAVIVLIASAAFVYLRRSGVDDAAESPAAASAPSVPAAVGEPSGAPVNLPPLDQSDALVRQLVSRLSSHPRVTAWLATDGLIRNFTVVVENISNGQTPAGHLRVLRPLGPFRVNTRGGRLMIDPATYSRYDGLAGAVDSIDAAGAARIYSTLEPRIQEAYAELGYQQPFDGALSRAIGALLQAPVLDAGVPLEPEGAVEYRFADQRVEALTAAQKQLVRMGPANTRVIQAKLREIAAAIGLPAGR